MIGQEFSIFGDWFKILFIENNGMAFGMELGNGKFGKTILSLFRIVAVAGIGWIYFKITQRQSSAGSSIFFRFDFLRCYWKYF